MRCISTLVWQRRVALAIAVPVLLCSSTSLTVVVVVNIAVGKRVCVCGGGGEEKSQATFDRNTFNHPCVVHVVLPFVCSFTLHHDAS